MKSPAYNFLPNSIRARLSLLFSVVFGAALISTNFVSYRLFTYAHRDDFDAFLFNHVLNLAGSVDVAVRTKVLTEKGDVIKKRRLYDAESAYSVLVNREGQVLAASENMAGKTPVFYRRSDFRASRRTGVSFRTLPELEFSAGVDLGQPYRLVSHLVYLHGVEPALLQIAAPLTQLERESREFRYLLVVIILFTLVVSGLLGYFASRRAFSPVMEIVERTAQIEMRSLSERIEVRESDAELKELGRTFNQLLDRVEHAVMAQERFIADASHQLKTPLAVIRGELELLQDRADHSPEVGEALRNTSQEVAQLIRLVENLLLLARMDAGKGTLEFHTVRMDELLSETLARLQFVAKGKQVKLNSELVPYAQQPENKIDFEFQGDAGLLRCLMENLTENAIKYSENGSEVKVRLAEGSNGYELSVSDRGKGMSPEEKASIFDRFFRDPKKTVFAAGSGLGLSIAKKICEVHGGTISVESQLNVGSIFRVQLRKS